MWTVATGLPKTGDAANLTAYVSKDNGAFTILADTSAAEDDGTNGAGYYTFDLAIAETNADKLKFSVKSSTSGVVGLAVPPVVHALPPSFTDTVLSNLSTNAQQVANEFPVNTRRAAYGNVASGAGVNVNLNFTSGAPEAANQYAGATVVFYNPDDASFTRGVRIKSHDAFGQSNPVAFVLEATMDPSTSPDSWIIVPDSPLDLAAIWAYATRTLTSGSGSYLTPFTIAANNPRFATRDLPKILQGSAPAEIFACVDDTGTSIDLTGKTVRFVVFSRTNGANTPYDDTVSEGWQYQTGGSGITVGTGTNSNQVTIQHAATNNATAGAFEYELWNVTDKLPLSTGKMPIVPGLIGV